MNTKAVRDVSIAVAVVGLVVLGGLALLRYVAERAFPRPITAVAGVAVDPETNRVVYFAERD